MRRREISPEFWTDEKVVSVSDGAKLLFQGLWNLADREGRLEDRPMVIGFKVRPWDPSAAAGFLTELAAVGLITRYTVDGLKLLLVPNFTTHQHVHPKEVASKLPPPQQVPEITVPRAETRKNPVLTGQVSEFPDLPGNADTCRAGSSFPSLPSGSSFPSGSSENQFDFEKNPPADGDRFFAWAQQTRAEALNVPREPPPKFIRSLGNWWHTAQLELGVDAGRRLQAAWAAFLVDPYWRERNCPWNAWQKRWAALVPPPGPPPAQKCAVCLVELGADGAAVGSVGVGAQGRKVCYPHYGEVAGRLRADGVFDDAPEADGVLDAVIAELECKGAA